MILKWTPSKKLRKDDHACMVALKRAHLGLKWPQPELVRTGVFGDSLGAFRHSMLGQLSRQEQPDSRLEVMSFLLL